MSRFVLAFSIGAALFVASSHLVGQGPAPKKVANKTASAWTVDDVVLAEDASEMRISPDGQWVVWIKRAPDKEKNEMVGHLMLSSLTNPLEIQLTRGSHASTLPEWSPDGKLIAFISARPIAKSKREDDDSDDAKSQIWLINPRGGEPWALTQSPRDVRAFAWTDPDTIVYVAQEKKAKLESDLKEKKDEALVADDEANEPPARLWKIGVKEKKTHRLTDNSDRIQSLNVSPDGRFAVTMHERSLSYNFDNKIKPAVYLYDLKKHQRKQLFTEPRFNPSNIYWEIGSKGFYLVNSFTTSPRYLHAYVSELYHHDITSQTTTKVPLDWERGLADPGDGFAVTPDGFVALLADGVRHVARRYVRQGKDWRSQGVADKNVQAVRVSRDGGTVVYQQSTAADPPRWFRAKLVGAEFKQPTILTDLQAELRKKPLARTEVFKWKGALGDEVEGLVSYPHDYEKGKKYPLVVLIHGGPYWADFDFWDERWAYVRNLLSARGAFIFRPNYHGSSNYGLAWAESIAGGKYYSLPVEDIEKGIDAFVALGQIDKTKIGVGGWSNGAILTMALITRRHYQAASAGAGGSEWVSDWGVCDFGMSFSNYYIGKPPYEAPELYRENAPYFQFPKVRTPIILFHGTDDKDVPSFHGPAQFRALQQIGKTEVRFLSFPGEKHGLKKLSHRRRKIEEELAWFDRHLFKTIEVANPSLKDDSPLAHALALKKAARQGRSYGEVIAGVLVPEVVDYKDLRIGRFEVTRAQFAAFDRTYLLPAGSENLPATGITFEQARAYCAWLKKTTGRPFRLGTLKELEPLHETDDLPENTLDYWAGYAINPEDGRKLREEIGKLGGADSLLKEVGSFRSADSKIGIFDLGGNAAEWADDGSKGKQLGGCADIAAGERHQRTPTLTYTGFRVICQ